MIETIFYDGSYYPKFQAEGNAARFAIPFAQTVCKGIGYDIGCNRVEWSLPGSVPIDPACSPHDGLKLPYERYNQVDYIFSSHCLEHIPQPWFNTLEYWVKNIKPGGVLFLYLPDYSQKYWRPWNNRKHVHAFTPEMLKDAFTALNLGSIFVSGVDLNNSFMIMANV